jgi:hypothetical protein
MVSLLSRRKRVALKRAEAFLAIYRGILPALGCTTADAFGVSVGEAGACRGLPAADQKVRVSASLT